MYWDTLQHPNRNALIELVAAELETLEGPARVLEFGCHAGMNFKRLHDRFPDREIRYCGVEPNHDAARFLRRELPFVELLEAEDGAFVTSSFPKGSEPTIGFINVVLYTLEPKRAHRVLEKLCRLCEVVIVGDQLANTGTEPEFRLDPEMYAHPFAHWLRDAGFSRQTTVDAPDPRPQLSGFLVARR